MRFIRYVILLPVVLLPATALAGTTPDQEARIKALEHQIIAPCCWRQTVDEHRSSAAEKVKGEIREMVTAGKTDDQVIASLVGEYGEAVLAVPRFQGFNRLLLVGIIAVVAYGGWSVVRFLRRWRRQGDAADKDAPAQTPPVDPELAARIERELQEDA